MCLPSPVMAAPAPANGLASVNAPTAPANVTSSSAVIDAGEPLSAASSTTAEPVMLTGPDELRTVIVTA